MKTLEVTIQIKVGTLEEMGLALTQHIGALKDKDKEIGEIGYGLGSGEYRGHVQYKKKRLDFTVQALQPIMEALQKELNEP